MLKRSWVWNYATRNGNKAVCNLCTDQVKNEFSCTSGSTGSIGKHLKVIHRKSPTITLNESQGHSSDVSATQTTYNDIEIAVEEEECLPRQERVLALAKDSTTQFRAGTDLALIEFVRARRALYDPTHPRFMNNVVKNAMWIKIGKKLRASPGACKRRWCNIRDQYRKTLRRCSFGGKFQYKFAGALGFMDRFLKIQLDPVCIKADTIKKENVDDDTTEEARDTATPNSEASFDAENDDAQSNQSESLIEVMFKNTSAPHKSSSPVADSHSQGVDVFLSAIGATLKGLSPYNLSLAKAEIFATAHKYEMKGIVESGGAPDVNPLP